MRGTKRYFVEHYRALETKAKKGRKDRENGRPTHDRGLAQERKAVFQNRLDSLAARAAWLVEQKNLGP